MQTFATEQIRNVALLSHTGAGKTTLGEAMLFVTGGVSRMGRVEDGTTTSDYEPEAVKRRSSTQLGVLPCLVDGHKVNVLDTPGYLDFVGEVVSATRVADAAALVVAANAGVEVGTALQWKRVRDAKLPSLIFVNKMDRENVEFDKVVQQIQARFGRHCVPVQVPIGAAQAFKGVVSIVPASGSAPAEMKAALDQARDRLAEAVAETDDELATKYLEEGTLSDDELGKAMRAAVMKGTIVPILAGSATQQLGVKELLQTIVSLLPSPAETKASTRDGKALAADAKAPMAALVFKTTADPYVGKLSFLRVYQGTLSSNATVLNASRGQNERLGQLFVPRGKGQDLVPSLAAGDIGAVGRLAVTTTGDSLCQPDAPTVMAGLEFPAPIYTLAVSPKAKTDSDKLGPSISRLVEEDPSLVFGRDQHTSETLLSGQGDVHLDVAFQKAQRKFGLSLLSHAPRIPYHETITGNIDHEERFKQQSGGHGHFAHIVVRLERGERGKGVEFATAVTGGAVPKEFFAYVEKGVLRASAEGVLAGFPVVDVRVVLHDGSYHPVDSAGMDFDLCGYRGFKTAFSKSNPVLMEPIAVLSVTAPDSSTGDIIGDLNAKRGRILGMTPQGDGTTLIEAEAPLSEVQRYALDLRAMTQGRGTFTLKVSRYEQLPAHLQQRVVEQATKRE